MVFLTSLKYCRLRVQKELYIELRGGFDAKKTPPMIGSVFNINSFYLLLNQPIYFRFISNTYF